MATIKLTGFNTSTGRNTTAGDTDVVTLDGSLTIGNADTDAVIFNADIDSNFVPDDDDTFNLGSEAKTWANIYVGAVNTTTINAPSDITVNCGGDINLDANGGQIYMKDGGITYLTFHVNGTQDEISAVGDLKFVASGDITLNAQGGDIYFQDNGTQRMRIEDATGDIAIGSHAPVYRLDVHDNTSSFIANLENDYTSAGADILRMKVNILNPASSSALIYIYDSSNTGIYAVQGNGAGGSTVVTSFTAGHDSVIEQSVDVVPGMIVESTGEVWYKPTDITFETALPKIRLADSDGSKRVFGVIAGYVEQPEDEQEWVHNGFTMRPGFPKYGQIAGVGANEWNIGTMSIGEGCIWITNINGDVENGDLIESSVIKGYGRKQDDDIMRSKTVAKCTETIDWSLITDTIEYNGTAYKRCLVCCTFHCG